MEVLLALVIGTLYAGGLYLMMRRTLIKLIIGLSLLSHGANLLIFTAAGLRDARPPIMKEGLKHFMSATADPVPQALILTAIVIGFAVTAFALVLFLRTYQEVKTDNVDTLRGTDT